MKHKPWFKFDPSSWLNKPELRMCTSSERGVLIDLMCLAHRNDPYGVIISDYSPKSIRMVARTIGVRYETVAKSVQKLIENGRVSVGTCNELVIPRMVEDEEYANKQSEFGKLGGNPTLKAPLKPEKKREEKKREDIIEIDWEKILRTWNKVVEDLPYPSIRSMTASRKKKYAIRCGEVGGEQQFWDIVKEQIVLLDDYVKKATWFKLDFLLDSENNFAKFAEGSYKKKAQQRTGGHCY